ncbi:myosin heavy chain, cardiac muscle alpha isoform, putative [Pediculus humanus corporis]|uniref:Myosin heavy chain, cardiac muscle alpha isoform, putative n=1 Tax=Pediculus humanus subsp. corporis TaxID=121224 RepID=E0W494_PEDHC|nr:myosin heavy chain, cardiac muscle alpha isoform, putative [Pediculus humanus corporis]EEB20450.1 myosin heavy chain, cardiac muscle alpha isoform, putative [Pediculus humanus corporis]
MRKQLLVFNLKNNNKHDSHKKYGKKDISSKINLHVEKNKLEEKIIDEKKLNKDVEKNIVIKSSDLIFDLCNIAELSKNCDEYTDKILVLKMFNKKQKECVEDVQELISKLKNLNPQNRGEKKAEDNLISLENHETQNVVGNEWETILNVKRKQLNDLHQFIQKSETVDKDYLHEKKQELEKIFEVSKSKLKQLTIEKTLQVMINETEGQSLNIEIQKFIDEIHEKNGRNLTLMSKQSIENSSSNFILKSFEKEIKKLNDENLTLKIYDWDEGNENEIGSLREKISLLKIERKSQGNKIIECVKEMENIFNSNDLNILHEIETNSKQVKKFSRSQIDLFVNVPSCAFRY